MSTSAIPRSLSTPNAEPPRPAAHPQPTEDARRKAQGKTTAPGAATRTGAAGQPELRPVQLELPLARPGLTGGAGPLASGAAGMRWPDGEVGRWLLDRLWGTPSIRAPDDQMRTGKRAPGDPSPLPSYDPAGALSNSTDFLSYQELSTLLNKLRGSSPTSLKKQLGEVDEIILLGSGISLSGRAFRNAILGIADEHVSSTPAEAATASDILMTLAPDGIQITDQNGDVRRFATSDFLKIVYEPKFDPAAHRSSDPAKIKQMRALLNKYKSTFHINIKNIPWYRLLGMFFAHHRPGAKTEEAELSKFIELEQKRRRSHLQLKPLTNDPIGRAARAFWTNTLANYDEETSLTPKRFVEEYQPQRVLDIKEENFLPAFLLKLKETGRSLRTELEPGNVDSAEAQATL